MKKKANRNSQSIPDGIEYQRPDEEERTPLLLLLLLCCINLLGEQQTRGTERRKYERKPVRYEKKTLDIVPRYKIESEDRGFRCPSSRI